MFVFQLTIFSFSRALQLTRNSLHKKRNWFLDIKYIYFHCNFFLQLQKYQSEVQSISIIRNWFQVFLPPLRYSRPKVFCKKGFHKNFAKFTGKYQCQSLILKKLQAEACNFIKKETRDSGTGVFLWILWNF